MISRLRRSYQSHAAIFAGGAPPGYDIILSAGQSNQFYGLTKDNGLDVSDARIYQLYSGVAGTLDTLSGSSANDPLDHPDNSGVAGPAIGHAVHFAKDYYIANGELLSPRKICIVPRAYGGTNLTASATNWGVQTDKDGAAVPYTSGQAGALVTSAAAALALSGTNEIKCLDWHQGEGDIQALTAFNATVIYKYRWRLLTLMRYLRSELGATMPIVMGQLSPWMLATGDGVNYIPAMANPINNVIRAMARRLPYIGIADSAGCDDGSSVHFSAAGQRTFAGAYWTAYGAAVANSNYPTSPTWDDIDYMTTAAGYPSGYAVSGIDLSGDANSGWKTALATMPNTTGKVYVEIKAQAVASAVNIGWIGLCNQDHTLGNYIGLGDGGSGHDEAGASIWGLAGQPSSVVGVGNSPWALRAALTLSGNVAVNDRMMFAIDRAAGKIWLGRNGTWLGSGDPAAGTNEWINGVPTTDLIFIAASIYTGTGNTWRIQAKASEQSYSPPSGFSAWGV